MTTRSAFCRLTLSVILAALVHGMFAPGTLASDRQRAERQVDDSRIERRAERRTERNAIVDNSASDGNGSTRADGRMSAEEHRQLRRDVRQAGRELYPDRRGRNRD